MLVEALESLVQSGEWIRLQTTATENSKVAELWGIDMPVNYSDTICRPHNEGFFFMQLQIYGNGWCTVTSYNRIKMADHGKGETYFQTYTHRRTFMTNPTDIDFEVQFQKSLLATEVPRRRR